MELSAQDFCDTRPDFIIDFGDEFGVQLSVNFRLRHGVVPFVNIERPHDVLVRGLKS